MRSGCCGSEIPDPVLFDPWIRDGKHPDLGWMIIQDNFFESLEKVFWVKNT
jgi:hypothetical protein